MGAKSKKCTYCDKRLRSPYRTMHRACERAYYDPRPYCAPVKQADAPWPPARFCAACHGYYNGRIEVTVCCGQDTQIFKR